MAEKKIQEKLTIEEYNQRRMALQKRFFQIEFYPWPVLLAFGVPLVTFIFLIIVYTLHIRGIAN